MIEKRIKNFNIMAAISKIMNDLIKHTNNAAAIKCPNEVITGHGMICKK